MVTIYDVAKKAGVSIATVSYALNNKNSVSGETRARIKAIAEEMGFIPNSLAKGLSTRKTNIMGLVVADIQNLFTSAFIKHLEHYARQGDFFLLLGSTANDIETEKEIIQRFIEKNVDSLIVMPGAYFSEEHFLRLAAKIKKRKIPFVVVNARTESIKVNSVCIDLEDGQYQITRHLLERGHRKLLYIGGLPNSLHSKLKHAGFKRALEDYGIQKDKSLILLCSNDYTFCEGYEIMNRYIRQGGNIPDAVAAINDAVAQGVIRALADNGYKIPKDVSVVGNDDISIPQADLVPLTTLRSPVEEIARLCISIIKDEDKNSQLVRQYLLSQQLVIRGSVKDR